MTNKHLNDADIQHYVLHKTTCAITILDHIRHCEICKLRTEQYKLIFDGIKELNKPAFDFNLSNLVMEQLPERRRKEHTGYAIYYFIFFIAIMFVGIVFYLFGIHLITLFVGIKPIIIGLTITAVTSILLFLCIDMYEKYQRKMELLNVQ